MSRNINKDSDELVKQHSPKIHKLIKCEGGSYGLDYGKRLGADYFNLILHFFDYDWQVKLNIIYTNLLTELFLLVANFYAIGNTYHFALGWQNVIKPKKTFLQSGSISLVYLANSILMKIWLKICFQ